MEGAAQAGAGRRHGEGVAPPSETRRPCEKYAPKFAGDRDSVCVCGFSRRLHQAVSYKGVLGTYGGLAGRVHAVGEPPPKRRRRKKGESRGCEWRQGIILNCDTPPIARQSGVGARLGGACPTATPIMVATPRPLPVPVPRFAPSQAVDASACGGSSAAMLLLGMRGEVPQRNLAIGSCSPDKDCSSATTSRKHPRAPPG